MWVVRGATLCVVGLGGVCGLRCRCAAVCGVRRSMLRQTRARRQNTVLRLEHRDENSAYMVKKNKAKIVRCTVYGPLALASPPAHYAAQMRRATAAALSTESRPSRMLDRRL